MPCFAIRLILIIHILYFLPVRFNSMIHSIPSIPNDRSHPLPKKAAAVDPKKEKENDTAEEEAAAAKAKAKADAMARANAKLGIGSGVIAGSSSSESANAFASGSNQNSGNVMTGRPTSRVLAPPGGHCSIQLF
jgi:hypothetical protein